MRVKTRADDVTIRVRRKFRNWLHEEAKRRGGVSLWWLLEHFAQMYLGGPKPWDQKEAEDE